MSENAMKISRLKKQYRRKILLLILCVCIGFLIIIGIVNYISKDSFTKALEDSIQLYGEDFTYALSVYLIENKTFKDYKKADFKYSRNEIVQIANKLKSEDIKENYDSYYKGIIKENKKGIQYNWFFPIASGYKMKNKNDWGDSRVFGGERKHEGNDIMCKEGTPIIAVESGTIRKIGWNRYGGWRISIKNENGVRYWYYAHMRKLHPYVKTLRKGSKIKGGQVIGYVGSTGYSKNLLPETMPENNSAVDGNFEPHLHIGVYLLENSKSTPYNPFPILEVLKNKKAKVMKDGAEYVSVGI